MERRIIIGERRSGKTTAMLKWVREAPEDEHRVVVSHTHQEAMRLRRENPDLESWQFVGLSEVLRQGNSVFSGVLVGRGGRVVLGIDNLDNALSQLIYWPVGALSLTDEGWRSIDADW